jgi:hypothetical protein
MIVVAKAEKFEPGTTPNARLMRNYLFISLSVALLSLLALLSLPPRDNATAPDYLSQITWDGASSWYRDFGGRYAPQIQDQDIFYSNIGSSVTAAKNADIVLLGPSFVSYAIDRDTLRASTPLSQLKIYNMAFVGIRGGEFSRRVIERWSIRAPLWVINVDDQFVHFFSSDLNVTLGPQKMPVDAIRRNRLRGYLTATGRNLRWRIEDMLAMLRDGHFSQTGIYRNIEDGDMAVDTNPAYLADDNKSMLSARDQECHINLEAIDYARAFLKEIGGHAVLMLVPHSQSCRGQAAELAKALNMELITPPFDGLTTVDGGGHLDKNGARIFTSYLARELVKTVAFQRVFAGQMGDLNQKSELQ